jgi:hypothetical protein
MSEPLTQEAIDGTNVENLDENDGLFAKLRSIRL